MVNFKLEFSGETIKEGEVEYHVIDARQVGVGKIYRGGKLSGVFVNDENKLIGEYNSSALDLSGIELIGGNNSALDFNGVDGILLVRKAPSRNLMAKLVMAKLVGIPADFWGDIIYEYYYHGKLHRKNNPAYICGKDKKYYKHGNFHRLNGPSYLFYGEGRYYVNGVDIPNSLPKFNKGKIVNGIELTKQKIIEAMLFDREYGKFLQEKYVNNVG